MRMSSLPTSLIAADEDVAQAAAERMADVAWQRLSSQSVSTAEVGGWLSTAACDGVKEAWPEAEHGDAVDVVVATPTGADTPAEV